VPIYVYRCDCGAQFERLLPVGADAPECPECGGATRKVPAGAGLGGRAGGGSAGRAGGGPAGRPSTDRPGPVSGAAQVEGLRTGGPEKVQREVQFRQRLQGTQAAKPASEGH